MSPEHDHFARDAKIRADHHLRSDSTADRVLDVRMSTTGDVDVQTCTAACFASGYPLAGMEFADECCECNSVCGHGTDRWITFSDV